MKKGAKGIDISEWNANINYTLVGRKIDFVIIRDGYGKQTKDKLFDTHVAGFKALGKEIQTYHFIYAVNAAEARQNALAAVKHAQAAGLPKGTRIWCDFEYDTVDQAKKKGIILGRMECDLFTRTFCDAVKEAGYETGIYTNQDYLARMYSAETIAKYPLWIASYTRACPRKDAMMWQYSSNGRLGMFNGNFDLDEYLGESTEKPSEPVKQPEPVKGYEVSLDTVKNGSRGAYALLAQRLLKSYGYSLTLDGIIGAQSEKAIKQFQRHNGLTADGICGANTWHKLTGV